MSRAETAKPDAPAAAYAALFAGALAMAVSPVLVRLADVGPFSSAFWRVALSIPILVAWDRINPARGGRRLRVTWPLVLAGLAFAGDLIFWHLAILKTTIANATFFATTAPLWVLLISVIFLGERARAPVVGGLALCMLGGVALLGETTTLAPERLTGDLFGIVTAMFFGLYFIFVQRARRDNGSVRVMLVSSIVTAAVLLIVALGAGESLMPQTLNGLMVLVALALVSHLGGQGLLAYALGTLPATFSSLVMFLEALAAAALAWVLLGEALSMIQVLGGLVIVAGIWIARPRPVEDRR